MNVCRALHKSYDAVMLNETHTTAFCCSLTRRAFTVNPAPLTDVIIHVLIQRLDIITRARRDATPRSGRDAGFHHRGHGYISDAPHRNPKTRLFVYLLMNGGRVHNAPPRCFFFFTLSAFLTKRVKRRQTERASLSTRGVTHLFVIHAVRARDAL